MQLHRSPPINIEDIGIIHFRLRGPSDEGTSSQLIQADVKLDGSTIFVFFSRGIIWPFAIENESDYIVNFYQKVSLLLVSASFLKPVARTSPRMTKDRRIEHLRPTLSNLSQLHNMHGTSPQPEIRK